MPKKSPVLVTISTYPNALEAQKAMSLLQLNAILSYIDNNPKKGKLGVTFDLKVSSTDYDLAYLVLKDYIEKAERKNQESPIDFNSIFVCPSCGQLNENKKVRESKPNLLKRIFSILSVSERIISCNFCKMKFSKSELVKKD